MKKANVGLRNLDLKSRYRSGVEEVVSEFYYPALGVAKAFDRAVGYFSSAALEMYSHQLERFVDGEGTMRLVASPCFQPDDLHRMKEGYSLRETIQAVTLRELEKELPENVLARIGILGQLIASKRLEIKLAFVNSPSGIGIFHEKIGIFHDPYGDFVSFTGSNNETFGGLAANFESMDVYCSWDNRDRERAERIAKDFDELWSRQNSFVEVVDFPVVASEKLQEIAHSHRQRAAALRNPFADSSAHQKNSFDERLTIPKFLEPRDYQRNAINCWLANGGLGIMNMATGTGKTKTALMAASKVNEILSESKSSFLLLVVAPFQHLVDQWNEEVTEFGMRARLVYESSAKWLPKVASDIRRLNFLSGQTAVWICTNSSFFSDGLQGLLAEVRCPVMIIVDEAHNVGSPAFRDLLPPNSKYRLALSATPERWLDDEGTRAIENYFGKTVFTLTLDEAIHKLNALTKYEYFPRLVELTEEEATNYKVLSAKIAKLSQIHGLDEDSPVSDLLRKRSNILGHAAAKTALLKADLIRHKDESFQLVYCAEGKRIVGDHDGSSQVQQILKLLGRELGMKAQSYVHDTKRKDRLKLLERFSKGEDLQVLVAIKCLDEGVDIPEARIGFLLASSSNPRQFIQRRGRLLRKAPGKDSAIIYDYIVVPPKDADLDWEIERKLISRELSRAEEFARISENYGVSLKLFRSLRDEYDLYDM